MASKKTSRKGTSGKARASGTAALDSMSQIWLAGLGAMAKAQRGTPQLLQDLIAEGTRVQSKTRGVAEKAVRSMVSNVRSSINARVDDVRGQATNALNDLEKIFQTRVHRALTQLGVPSAEEIAALSKRVETLNASVERLAHARSATKRRGNAAASKATGASAAPTP